ncbi:MAG: hypothetical protein QOG32_1069 [Chloroflexota bacterium]|nr:hypothetical protein [Chloroflexota bacterium]
MGSRRHARRLVAPWIALALAVATLPTAGLFDAPAARGAIEIRPRIPGIAPLSKEVYGYLPYWRLDVGTVDRIRYDLVSTIAIFGLGIKADGNLDTAWVGYREYIGDDAAAVTNAAHDRGVRVVPTFQLFDSGALPKLTAFLGSAAAQTRFISQAIALMTARKADGANLDFEPMPAEQTAAYLTFVSRFGAAMKAAIPGATLVNATSAGAGSALLIGLVPLVDRQLIMTYNYRYAASTVTGAIAPLDHAARNVKIHIARILQWVPAGKVLLGVPYYGYDWPVTSPVPNATVQSNKTLYGPVASVTYASARDFLTAHPAAVRHYDALEGSGFYTYWDPAKSTYRQVYFEEERSLNDKYDYAIVNGLAGVGIWTLDNDRGYNELWDLLRVKFYAPVRRASVGAAIKTVTRTAGSVYATFIYSARNTGTVPLRGSWRWAIRNARGLVVAKGTFAAQTIYPGRLVVHGIKARLGLATRLAAGTYKLRVDFGTTTRRWSSLDVSFRQRY